jgi:hypothetical protein
VAGEAGGCATIIAKRPDTLSAALASLKVSQNHGERALTVIARRRCAGQNSGSIGFPSV